MSSPGKFIFFDTETDAIGRMSKPVTQTLMQLAWIVTDADGTVLATHDRLVKGATRVGRYAPHDLTPSHVNANGEDASVVVDAFLGDARVVVANGGHLVAHNADFDIGVLEHAHTLDPDLKSATFCTMKATEIMSYVGRRTPRGMKYPKLSELFIKLFNRKPTETLHDALGDTNVLRKCFHELIRLGVISFTATPSDFETPTVVDRAACDVYINASDVATLSGLMVKFKRHPYEIAEKVLSRHGSAFGVTARGKALTEVASKTVCTKSPLGKREREMHAEVDGRGYTPEIAREAKRIITSKLACSQDRDNNIITSKLACSQDRDNNIITSKLACSQDRDNNAPYHLRIGTAGGVVCGLVGRVDGFSDGKLVELKTRTLRLFHRMRDYETVQLEIYMRMVGVDSAVLIESFTDGEEVTRDEHVVRRNDELWTHLVADCVRFCSKILTLVANPAMWAEWEGGDVDVRKGVWDRIEQ